MQSYIIDLVTQIHLGSMQQFCNLRQSQAICWDYSQKHVIIVYYPQAQVILLHTRWDEGIPGWTQIQNMY